MERQGTLGSRIEIRLSDATRAELKRRADLEDMAEATFIRRALKRALVRRR